ncbi:urease accessory protein UreE [Otariodibacter sp.]|uniref:urease accessory protein UreE n=1 Tax=Otariodibacter sp. TaxID=3030919 RepID=UPI0026296CF6|nr:urease accessory protein UreE [Otariodibacter sp.]
MQKIKSILPVVENVIGHLDELEKNGKIKGQQIDYISLNWFESERNILRKVSQAGYEILFRILKEGSRLTHNDVVFLDENLAVVINIIPSEVIVLSPKTLPEMARACYEIGNKHSPLFLDGDEILLPYDKPMYEWLEAANFNPKQETRRLTNPLRANSAQGHGHSHSHGEHTHTHSEHTHNEHYHHHGDGNWHKH